MTSLNDLQTLLARYKQDHLVKFWDDLTDSDRQELAEDIQSLNLCEVQELFKRATESLSDAGAKLDDRLQPIPDSKFLWINETSQDQLETYRKTGLKHIANSEVGVLLMAGGQGTRLGFAKPKGMYKIGLPSGKSLFQIQAERIIKLQQLAAKEFGGNGIIMWYVMTSEQTMEPTRLYFEENHYFGLDKDNVRFFEQGSLPCFEFDGKIILDEKHKIARAPDGNGGIYRALYSQGILEDINKRNIKYLHTHSVDNILIKVADPIFVGYCSEENADCGAKVVEKSHPNEAVGVVCMVDGKYQVVEYSEISAKTAELINSDGRLTFNAGNICNHMFSANFLNRIAQQFERELKLHVAKKKIPFVDNSGKRITPSNPNGIKIEKFVFDVFEFAEVFVAMEVLRDEEFSALKNSDEAGKDCPSTAKSDIFRLHKRYIERANGTVHGEECEISPLLSYAGEGLNFVEFKTFSTPLHLETITQLNGHKI